MANLIRIISDYLTIDRENTYKTILNALTVFLGLLVTQGGTAFALIIVARSVLPIEYGQYIASYGLLSFLVVVPNYGFESWLLTKGGTTPKQVSKLWYSIFKLISGLLIVWGVCVLFLGMILPYNTFPPLIMWPTILGVMFDSLILVTYAAFRCLGEHKQVAFLQAFASLSLLGFTLLLPHISTYIILFAVGRAALSFLVLVVTILRLTQILGTPAELVSVSYLLKDAHPFMVADIASSIYVKADVNIISLLIGSVGTSVYGPALNLLRTSFLVPRSIFLFSVPLLSKFYVESKSLFRKMSILQILVQALLGLTMSIVFFAIAPVLITIVFGEAYQSSGLILQFLSPIPFFRSLNFGLGALLTTANHQKERTKVQVLCALFNVIANLIVIVPFGVLAVAVVYTLSEVLLALGYGILIIMNQRSKILET